MNKKSPAFTVIEIVIVILIALASSIIFFSQKHSLQVALRDNQRKSSINAMYYALENVYYPVHSSYPRTLNSGVLPSVDPSVFTDPSGNNIGSASSDYRYEPSNCAGEVCQKYVLRASLEGEADFVKNSKN